MLSLEQGRLEVTKLEVLKAVRYLFLPTVKGINNYQVVSLEELVELDKAAFNRQVDLTVNQSMVDTIKEAKLEDLINLSLVLEEDMDKVASYQLKVQPMEFQAQQWEELKEVKLVDRKFQVLKLEEPMDKVTALDKFKVQLWLLQLLNQVLLNQEWEVQKLTSNSKAQAQQWKCKKQDLKDLQTLEVQADMELQEWGNGNDNKQRKMNQERNIEDFHLTLFIMI